MFQKFEINGVHTAVDQELHDYVVKKIGDLDRYLPRHARQSAHAEVHLREAKAKNNDSCLCEVTIYLPKQTLISKEQAQTMTAAVDIVESKLKIQLKKYKDLHDNARSRRHLMGRFLRKSK